MALDLSRDYLLIDDPVSVRYARKTAESVWAAAVDVDYCQRNQVSKDDIKANSSLLQKEASVFHLWRAMLGDIVPKVGDKLAHDDAVWIVQSVQHNDRDANGVQRYRVVVTRSTGAQTL